MTVLYKMTYSYDEFYNPDDNRTRREKTEYYGTSKHIKDFLKDNLETLLEGDLGNKVFPIDAILLKQYFWGKNKIIFVKFQNFKCNQKYNYKH